MKAIICTKYGPPEVLQLQEVEKPIPNDNEVLVRIYATSVHIGDWRLRSFTVPPLFRLPFRISMGFRGPRKKILGEEISGEIEAVGKDVKRFKEGDQVFGDTGAVLGAYAEYVCLPEEGVLTIKPVNMTYEEAAAGPVSALTALYYLRRAGIQSGQKVLINGASGALGTAAVQLAKHFGAEVTGVCSSVNLELVKSLGADKVIDYLVSVPTLVILLQMLWTSMIGSKRAILGVPKSGVEDLNFLKELIEAEAIKPVIARTYPLEQIVGAHRYVDTRRKKGNVVVTVEHEVRVAD
jgi:NADPH:quinone reductase-like Zn-dependent oxidoreductase